MTWATLGMVIFTVVLTGLMFLALRPPKRRMPTVEELLAAISEPRHHYRMPQISQALQAEDMVFLRARGQARLAERLRRERKKIVLSYLLCLEEDFQNLLEASRFLATISPKAETMRELDRLALGIRFRACCTHLRWSLKLGLEPWPALEALSGMASEVAHQLEVAVGQMGEIAALGPSAESLMDKRSHRTR